MLKLQKQIRQCMSPISLQYNIDLDFKALKKLKLLLVVNPPWCSLFYYMYIYIHTSDAHVTLHVVHVVL